MLEEALEFWQEATTDGYKNMREKLDDELMYVKSQWDSGHLQWSKKTLDTLAEAYPASREDAVFAKQGDLQGHDGDFHPDGDVL